MDAPTPQHWLHKKARRSGLRRVGGGWQSRRKFREEELRSAW